MKPRVRGGATLLLVLLFPFRLEAQEPPDFAGHWEGAIDLPGQPLVIKVDLTLTDKGWIGTIDIPPQGATGLTLQGVGVDRGAITFRIAGVPGDPTFTGVLSEGRISGTFRQSGQEVPFHLGREVVAAPSRPQEPKPPFPYRVEEVAVHRGGITLAGTLTLPEGEGPFPAAVLISGSGAQDRDETLFGHKPFLVLADYLTRAGIAVVRSDDRGIGGSGGRLSDVTSADLADDALAWIDLLAGRPEIDRTAIGMIGHSEGGIIGPLAAVQSPRVAFLVLMGGTGLPGGEILVAQTAALTRASGRDSLFVARQAEAERRLVEAVVAGAGAEEVRELLRALARVQMETVPDGPEKEATIGQAVAAGLAEMQKPWMGFFLGYDPRPALRRVRVPVLVLNGERDLQVLPDPNLGEIERALREGGNQDVTVRRMPGLNHLFQPARTGLPDEYGAIETTLAPVVLETIREWVLSRFDGPSGGRNEWGDPFAAVSSRSIRREAHLRSPGAGQLEDAGPAGARVGGLLRAEVALPSGPKLEGTVGSDPAFPTPGFEPWSCGGSTSHWGDPAPC